MNKKVFDTSKNRTKPGNPYYLVLFANRTKPGTVLIETVLSGESLYMNFTFLQYCYCTEIWFISNDVSSVVEYKSNLILL